MRLKELARLFGNINLSLAILAAEFPQTAPVVFPNER